MNVANAKNISQDARLFCLLIPAYVFVFFLLLCIGTFSFSDPNGFFCLDRDLVLQDYVVELFCRSMVGQ